MSELLPSELREIDAALTRTITHLVAFSDSDPYPDDPRWSPWTRFQKPLIDRCDRARKIVRNALG